MFRNAISTPNSLSIPLLGRQMLSTGRSSCSLLFCSQFPRCFGPVRTSIQRTTTELLRMKRTSTTWRPWRRRSRYPTSGLYFSRFSASSSPFLPSSSKHSPVLRLLFVTRRIFPSSTGAFSSCSPSAHSLQLWAYPSAPCSPTDAHPGTSAWGRLSWLSQGSLIWRGIGDKRRSTTSKENHQRPSRLI